MKYKKLCITSLLIAFVFLFSYIIFFAASAETYVLFPDIPNIGSNTSLTQNKYSEHWEHWSQGASKYRYTKSGGDGAMRWGCHVVSYAKMFVEMGIESGDPDVFNPDILFEWGMGKYFRTEDTAELCGTINQRVPQDYAAYKGVDLKYEGYITLTGTRTQNAELIMSKIKSGYYVILNCTAHQVYIGRDASLKAGTPIILDSAHDKSVAPYHTRTYVDYTKLYFDRMYLFSIDESIIPNTSPIYYTYTANLTEKSASVREVVKDLLYDDLGFCIGLTEDSLVEHPESEKNSFPAYCGGEASYGTMKWHGELEPGTTYYFKMFVVYKGTKYYSDINSFTTLGEKKHTVSFRDGDGKLITAFTVKDGKDAIPPEAPEKDGCVFIGWDKPTDGIKGDTEFSPVYVRKGDADGDGIVDAKDYVKMRLLLLGVGKPTESQILSCDCNGDGVISAEDYIALRLSLIG